MLEIQSIILSFIVICLFVKFRLGLALYLAYFILVPIKWTYIGGWYISMIIINVILLVALLVDCVKHNTMLEFRPAKLLKPLFVLYVLYFIIALFQSKMDFGIMFRYWYVDILHIFILPYAMLMSYSYDKKTLLYCRVALLFSFVVVILYSLWLLIYTKEINPYVLSMAVEHGSDLQMGQFEVSGREDITHRISSVFPHPMTYGLYLGMMTLLFFVLLSKSKYYMLGLVFSVVAIFTCGVRTPIAAIMLTFTIYIIQKKNLKLLFQSLAILIIGIIILLQFPAIYNMVNSIFMLDNEGGSSLNMRIEQFSGCWDIISNNIIVGNGYSWTDYYMTNFGSHPICKSFESLIIVLLCNSGVLGLVLFCSTIFSIYKYILRSFSKKYAYMILCIISYYISYSCITGEYGYMQYCTLFFSITYLHHLEFKENNK